MSASTCCTKPSIPGSSWSEMLTDSEIPSVLDTLTLVDTAPAPAVEVAPDATHRVLRELWHDKTALVAVVFIVVVVATALFAPWVAPHDPTEQSLIDRLHPPAWSSGDWSHPLG